LFCNHSQFSPVSFFGFNSGFGFRIKLAHGQNPLG
jgi:hypothetical protein